MFTKIKPRSVTLNAPSVDGRMIGVILDVSADEALLSVLAL
jgi:hypothetical protein